MANPLETKWPFSLGDRLRDRITGFTGICIARTEWLNGCFRLTIQAPMDKDGKVPDAQTFDDAQLEVVESEPLVVKKDRDGGPTPSPQRTTAIKP